MLSGVHAILGYRGSGKSRLARAIVASARKLLVVDTLGEHSALGTAVTPEQLAQVLSSNPEAYRYVIRTTDYEVVEWVERVAAARPGCCLFLDEIDFWYADSRTTLGVGVNALSQYGRHFNQSLVAVARRPVCISQHIVSQATLWCFPMRGIRDRQYVREYSNGYDPVDLRILQEKMIEGPEGPEQVIIETELARAGLRGVELGRFNLETGQYTVPTDESFSQEMS